MAYTKEQLAAYAKTQKAFEEKMAKRIKYQKEQQEKKKQQAAAAKAAASAAKEKQDKEGASPEPSVWYLSCETSDGDIKSLVEDGIESINVTDVADNNRADYIEHPMEDGTVKIDNKVLKPEKISVRGWVKKCYAKKTKDALEKIHKCYDTGTYLEVFSAYRKYTGFYLANYSIRASARKIDVYDVSLELQQLFVGTSETSITNNPSNADTVDAGGLGK